MSSIYVIPTMIKVPSLALLGKVQRSSWLGPALSELTVWVGAAHQCLDCRSVWPSRLWRYG